MAHVQTMLIDPADAVHLNVGGQRLTTSRTVLRRGAPDFFDSIMDAEPGGDQRASSDACSQRVVTTIPPHGCPLAITTASREISATSPVTARLHGNMQEREDTRVVEVLSNLLQVLQYKRLHVGRVE
jgi:hypothetical protein